MKVVNCPLSAVRGLLIFAQDIFQKTTLNKSAADCEQRTAD